MPKDHVLHFTQSLKGEPIALVAGGAGFLGSRLCEKLLETCAVVCVDNLKVGKRENLKECFTHGKFTFIEHDITKPVTDLLRKKVDYVFYVAAADEQEHEKASLNDLLLNTHGTRNLLEKAVSDKAKFLLVSTLAHEESVGEIINAAQALLFSESLTKEYIKKFGIKAKIVRVGHLFGPRMPLFAQNPISVIVKNLLAKGEVRLANDQLTRLYPVFIDDVIDAILRITFSGQTHGKVFNLLPNQSVSLLELAQLIPEIDPQFSLKFSQAGILLNPFSKEHFEEGTSIAVSQKASLVLQLTKTINFFRKHGGAHEEKKEEVVDQEKGFSIRSGFVLFLAATIFFGVIIPFVLLGATSVLAVERLNQAYVATRGGNFPKASAAASSSRQLFSASKGVLGFLKYHFVLTGQRSKSETLFTLLKSGEDISDSSMHLANAANLLSEFFKKSIEGQGLLAKPILDGAISELNTAAVRLPLVEKELEGALVMPLPQMLVTYIDGKRQILSEQRKTITTMQTFAGLLPDLLGFEDKRVYALLFQNNMELRPGGGFIGSYGIVTFEKGSLTAFDVYDVYTADGQLKGHIEPPAPIRKHLNQPNWFLRDSNWDLDFQKSASQAAFFLQKETGVTVHGVIAFDVSFAQLLLEAVGPVALPDYKETITAGNLFAKAQEQVETDFFPGSTQKKDFLGALARKIIDRLLHEDDVALLSVLSAVQKGLVEKHFLLSLSNPSIQQIINLSNWGGTFIDVPTQEGTFSDFRMISEANLGVNKVNFFVKRKVNDEIVIDTGGEINGRLTLTYANDGPAALPGGPYVNYLRVVFPQGTKVTAIAFDGKEARLQAPEASAGGGQATRSAKAKDGPLRPADSEARGLEVEEATESGKSVFGFLVTVPSQTSKQVSISYELPAPYPLLPGSTTYAYIFQKQPGVVDDALSVMIHYPKELRIKGTNASVFQEKQLVSLSTDLSEDRLFTVEFIQ